MLSIVVPVFNEEESLGELCSKIDETCQAEGIDYEIVFVDDGSTDTSWQQIEKHSSDRILGIRFRRNFGKAAALSAGFQAARGETIITMDADLQDDPNEIPRLMKKLDEGYDVISGWKKVRHDPWHKVLPSRVFNGMISWLTGVHLHDHNCGLKAYRRAVIKEVNLYGEMHRFIPVLAAAKGFRISELVIKHHARMHGQSKYGFERFIKGFLDLLTVYFLTGYGNRPQHLIGSVGLASFLAGSCGLFLLSILWVLSRLSSTWDDVHLHASAIFYFCIVGVLLGVQLLSLGFLAELITARSGEMQNPYCISDRTPRASASTTANVGSELGDG